MTLLAFGSATAGGVVGWTLFYVGLDLWALLVGAATMVVLAAVVSRLERTQQLTKVMLIAVACVLLTWPLVWIAVVFVRYWITGQTVGS